MLIRSRVHAANYTIDSTDGEWKLHVVECMECGEMQTWMLRCRGTKDSPCKRLGSYHTHHACLTCGHVWVTDGWKN